MSARITGYEVRKEFLGDGFYIVALTESKRTPCFVVGPAYDFEDRDIAQKQVDALIEKYGLPVDVVTIVEHFNREILNLNENG